jgi:all-trans-retinol 13,14-reductase
LSTRHFVNHEHGEAYGLGHTPARFLLRSLAPRAPIGRLYLAGADVALCGVMGALSGAVLCASAVLGRNVFGELAKTPWRASVCRLRAASTRVARSGRCDLY